MMSLLRNRTRDFQKVFINAEAFLGGFFSGGGVLFFFFSSGLARTSGAGKLQSPEYSRVGADRIPTSRTSGSEGGQITMWGSRRHNQLWKNQRAAGRRLRQEGWGARDMSSPSMSRLGIPDWEGDTTQQHLGW